MTSEITFALVGCGRIGKRHAELCQQFGRLEGVCDVDKERCNSFSAHYECPGFTSFADMLAALAGKAAVLVIATPNYLHAPQTIAALEGGFHVLCEKPMAIGHVDALAMQHAANRYGKHLMVVKQNRFNPPVQAVKQLLDREGLGAIHFAQLNCFWNRDEAYYKDSWKGTLDKDGGTLYTQFSHFVDLLIWFLGPLQPVSVQLANFQHLQITDIEDTGIATLRFGTNGLASMQYTVNAFAKNMEGSIALFGERGTVKIGGQYLNELEYQAMDGALITGLPAGNPANNYGHYTGSMSNHDLVYQDLAGVLGGNASLVSNVNDAVATVAAIESIYVMGR